MTTAETRTLLSVRGESERVVTPDQATVFATANAIADSKQQAYVAVAQVVGELTTALTELGGEVLDAGNTRASLTWSTQSIRTNDEYGHDKVTGSGGPTGRHVAEANLLVTVRDFALLGRLEAALTASDAVSLQSVQWSVDADNSEWALVRAEAIHAALRKGRDYASALRGTVTGVEHVADAGLLGGSSAPERLYAATAASARMLASPGAPSLDPVPQVLSATIEARLSATIVASQ
jgi:uncharacterized protein YggE